MHNPLYSEEPFDKWHAWMDLCMMADDKGEIKTSLKVLQNRWFWKSDHKVRAFLGALKGADLVEVKGVRNKGTLIRINTDFSVISKTRKGEVKGAVKDADSVNEELLLKEVEGMKSPSNSTSAHTEGEDTSWMMEDDFDD